MCFGHRQHRNDPVQVADVEEHAFGNHSCHFSWCKIHNKQGLLTLDLARVGTLTFHSSQNRALVVAKADFECDQLVRIGNIGHGQNCADPHVDLVTQ